VSHVAKTVIDTLDNIKADQQASKMGSYILTALKDKLQDADGVVDIRGMGLLLGIELDRPCAELVSKALAKGMLINVTAESVIRLLPPLIITEQDANQIVDVVGNLVLDFLG